MLCCSQSKMSFQKCIPVISLLSHAVNSLFLHSLAVGCCFSSLSMQELRLVWNSSLGIGIWTCASSQQDDSLLGLSVKSCPALQNQDRETLNWTAEGFAFILFWSKGLHGLLRVLSHLSGAALVHPAVQGMRNAGWRLLAGMDLVPSAWGRAAGIVCSQGRKEGSMSVL